MDNKSDVRFYAVLIILSLLFIQYCIIGVFVTIASMGWSGEITYDVWQLIGKVVVLTITIIFYYLYKKTDTSKGRKTTYKVYLIGFIIFSVEIGVFYGYLYFVEIGVFYGYLYLIGI